MASDGLRDAFQLDRPDLGERYVSGTRGFHDILTDQHLARSRVFTDPRGDVDGATTFVSKAALEAGIKGWIGSRRRFVPVEDTRSVRRDTLALNRAVVPIEVDPRDGTVTLDGRVLAVEPVRDVPLGRRYVLG
jgi:urease alpha subunit